MSSASRRIWSAWLVLLCLLAGPVHGDGPATLDVETQAEIDYLLERVEGSGYIFIRNGSEHESAEAARHMRRKYEHFLERGKIASVDDFIDMAGTKSLISGREYRVRMPDGTEVLTARWLRAEIEARRHGAAGVTR